MKNLNDYKNWLILNNCSSGITVYIPRLLEYFHKYAELTEENINQFIVDKKNKKLSEEYLNNYIKAIKSYCKFAQLNIRLPRAFKVTQKLQQYVSLDFFENQIVKDLPEIFTSIDIKKVETILYFMFFSGLRKSEILMLKKEHFNFKEAECKVYIPKRKEERLIPLTERIMKMIISYSYDNPSDINIFGITNKQLTYICKKIADNYKIKFSCHTFRHSFAMHMKKMGFDLQDIGLLLGHKNINSTLRYAKADIKEIKNKFKERIK